MREGEAGKKAKVTQHAGGQSVSEKSQSTRTSKNLFEKSNSKTQYFVREVKGHDHDMMFTKLIIHEDLPLNSGNLHTCMTSCWRYRT